MTAQIIQKVGWFSARAIKGEGVTYPAGGINLEIGNFKPKYITSYYIVSGGKPYFPIFDFANSKVKFVDTSGTEVSGTVDYQIILME